MPFGTLRIARPLPPIRTMRNRLPFILTLTGFLISCGGINDSNTSVVLVEDSQLTEAENTAREKPLDTAELIGCTCFDGISSAKTDKPIFAFDFSNGKSVTVCGHKEEDLDSKDLQISEFNVFDCSTGESLVEYGAMESCLIKTGKDSLIIQLLKFLPIGEDWKWTYVQIGEQVIIAENEELVVSGINARYHAKTISEEQQSTFIRSLEKGQGSGSNWEDDIGGLEVLSLLGNDEAWKILKNYEDFTGEKTDGALAEQWKDAIATVEWLSGK